MPYDTEEIRKRMSEQLGYKIAPPKPTPPRNHYRELLAVIIPKILDLLQEIAVGYTITRHIVMKHEALLTLTNNDDGLVILVHITGCDLRFILDPDVMRVFNITDPTCFDQIKLLLESENE